MTNQTTLTSPANLDPFRLHTPAEVRQWESAWADYRQALVAEQNKQRIKEQAEHAESKRILTDAEYFELAQKRESAHQKRLAERLAAEQAEQAAKEAYLASMPDVAEVLERSEYAFILKLQHWMQLGYTCDENSVQGMLPGFWCVKLNKPATAKRGSK